MVPRPGSGRLVGPAYASRLIEYAEAHWRPEVAGQCTDSLRRCRERLVQLNLLGGSLSFVTPGAIVINGGTNQYSSINICSNSSSAPRPPAASS